MSELVVIRHGQASFLSEDYDELSALGKKQAEALGRFFVERNRSFDGVLIGPRKRHLQTFESLGSAYQNKGCKIPEPVVHDGLDEYGIDQFVRGVGEERLQTIPGIRELVLGLNNASDSKEKVRAFQILFQAVAGLWVEGALEHPQIETWSAFKVRVHSTIEFATKKFGRGRRVLVISSAGTIGVILQKALGCSDLKALELGWRIWNTSVSQLLFSEQRFGLDVFNTMAHLPEEKNWSYR